MALANAEPTTLSPWRRSVGLSWVAVWLVFLGSPLASIWHHNGTIGRFVGTVAVVMFAACYLWLFITVRRRWRRDREKPRSFQVWLLLGGMVAMYALAVPFAQGSSDTMLVYLGAAAMFTFRPGVGVTIVLALAATAELSARAVTGWANEQWSGSFAILFAGAAVYATRIAARRSDDLLAARQEMAEMAIEEERSRMTRDLHDILGHSLTVITVKAELASRLVGADEARATAEIADIERLAREALTDVRATIAGRREVTLAPELINARAALASANIEPDVPGAVDDVPAANRELFGWTVREGVTNVLRHSKATRCEVRLSSTSVEIHDDGIGANPVDTDGNGLRGLRERVAREGASILTGTSPVLGGFMLQVTARPHADADE